jgi:hypothetical protein
LFLFSDSISILRVSLDLYSGAEGQTSILREYVAGLMYETAPLGSLTPMQLSALYVIVNRYAQSFAFREIHDNDTPYFVDLARSISPVKWREGLPRSGTYRYFGVGLTFPHLVTLLKDLERKGKLPDWLGIIDTIEEREAFISMMRLVCTHWSTKPPGRRHSRNFKKLPMQVVHGFRQVRAMIAGIAKLASSSYDPITTERARMERLGFGMVYAGEFVDKIKSTPIKPSPVVGTESQSNLQFIGGDTVENWIMQDLSESGLGGIAPKHPHWLKIGMLIGYRVEGGVGWSMGVVRRIGNTTQGQVSVGMEIFHQQTLCQRLGVLDKDYANIWDPTHNLGDAKIYGYIDTILLPETSSLLLEPNVYALGRRFMLMAKQQKKYIKFTGLIEKGVDFEHVSFIEIDPE